MQSLLKKLIIFPLVFIYSLEVASGVKFTESQFVNIFMHGNVFHLFLCCFCFWSMLENKPLANAHMLIVGLSAAILATYMSPYPFQGTSGIIFAITGIMLSAYNTKDNYLRVLSISTICTIVQPTSWCVHIIPLIIGFLYYRIINKIKKCLNIK